MVIEYDKNKLFHIIEPKPWYTVTLTFFFPGLGHCYIGEWKRGMYFLLSCMFLAIAFFALNTYPSPYEWELLAGLPLITMFFWCCIDSYKRAKCQAKEYVELKKFLELNGSCEIKLMK